MAFYYLLLGHLVGDFVLQTNKMAENKSVQWKWTLLHGLVVTFCTSVFSYTFGWTLFIAVLANGVLHFIIDFNKSRLGRILHLTELGQFLVDQLIHILLLYVISFTAVYENEPFLGIQTVRVLIAVVLATFFSAVFTQFILATLFPRADSRFFMEGEKSMGILTRIYGGIVFYLSFLRSPYYLLLLIIPAVIFYLRFTLGWNKWMSPSHLVIKLLLDTAISAVCIFPILFS